MICTLDPAQASARDAALLAHGPATRREPPHLPGDLMVQGRVRVAGRVERFDDAFGDGWRLVTRARVPSGAIDPRFAGIGGRVVVLGDDFDDVDGTYTAWLDGRGAAAVMQRPDFAVFGTGDPSELVTRACNDVECT
jgi:hypothetical protein